MVRVAIMQPYFLPYIGYFQMIKAVDVFVFYDDVNYIKRGWINRNKILVNQEGQYLTIPLREASQNKKINEIKTGIDTKELSRIFKTVEFSYKNAPYYAQVFPLLERILKLDSEFISDLAIESVKTLSEYLNLKTKFLISSKAFPETQSMERGNRLMEICHQLGAVNYINAIGGQEIYTKEDFAREKIHLSFIQSNNISYSQFGANFVPWLSILDVLMFNSPEVVNEFLNQYELI